MPNEILERCETLEECYEFMLGYAGQGLPSEESNPRVREFLGRALNALDGIAETCDTAIGSHAFLSVLRRDAADSAAAIGLVLAQPAVSSQLIDNLNASIHVRALLTDLFLVGEVLRNQR